MSQPRWTVPYTALGQEALPLKAELVSAFESVLDSGRYILGPQVMAFEQEFAKYCESDFAVGVDNGTSALYLVLQSLGLKPGDEVITAPNSFLASASTIALAGGRPVFVDIRPDGNLDPDRLESAITEQTRAIVPVHLTGRPARMPEILEIARRHNLFVMEDAAQAVGARLNGKRAGSWGEAACFSLHPLKNLRAIGDGGIVTTNDRMLYERLKQARNHGLRDREQCDFWSFNCRLDELQAALLRVHLRRLDEETVMRRSVALRYNDLLRSYVVVPDEGSGEYCVYQTYVVLAENRDELKSYLNEHGVEALVHYATPIHLQRAAAELGYKACDFPLTMRHVSQILSLPLYPTMTKGQQDEVVRLIAEFYKG